MNNLSLRKDSLQRSNYANSVTELKYRSPATYNLLNNSRLKRLRESQNAPQRIELQTKVYTTLNSINTGSTKNNLTRKAKDSKNDKDIDYFQEYLKQTDFELGKEYGFLKAIRLRFMIF